MVQVSDPAPVFAQGASASKDAKATHSIAVYVEGGGPRAGEVRETILTLLPAGTTAVDPGEFKQVLQKLGQKTPVGLALSLSNQRKGILGRFGKAADAIASEAVVIGFVRPKKGGGFEVVLLWVKSKESEPVIEQTVTLGQAGTKEEIAKALDPELAGMRAPDPVETAGAGGEGAAGSEGKGGEGGEGGDDGGDDAPTPGDRPENLLGREIIDAHLGFDLGGRFFSYNDGLSSNLRDYDVFGAPQIFLQAGVYPFSGMDTPVLQGLGIVGDFRIALGLGSETADGAQVDTTWYRWDAGIRLRQPLGSVETADDRRVILGLTGTIGQDSFTLEAPGLLQAELPSVSYTFLRVGLDAWFPAGPIWLTLKGGYLGAVSAGEVYDRFTATSIGGIDLGGGISIPIVAGLDARIMAEYVRWFYAYEPEVGDAFIAGGALDQYIHLQVGPGYVF